MSEQGELVDAGLEAAILRSVQADDTSVIAGSVRATIVQGDAWKNPPAGPRVRVSWQEKTPAGAIVLAGAWSTIERMAAVIDKHARRKDAQ